MTKASKKSSWKAYSKKGSKKRGPRPPSPRDAERSRAFIKERIRYLEDYVGLILEYLSNDAHFQHFVVDLLESPPLPPTGAEGDDSKGGLP